MDVKEGDAVSLSCHIGGTKEIKVSWFKGDSKVHPSALCKTEYTNGIAYLKISKATKSNSGEYTCTAENHIGSASCSCDLNVKGDVNVSLLFVLFFVVLKNTCMTSCFHAWCLPQIWCHQILSCFL